MESTQIFIPYRGFLPVFLVLGMPYCLFFQDLKDHRFLDMCANFLVLWRLFTPFI